jgi:hypothetical protein
MVSADLGLSRPRQTTASRVHAKGASVRTCPMTDSSYSDTSVMGNRQGN